MKQIMTLVVAAMLVGVAVVYFSNRDGDRPDRQSLRTEKLQLEEVDEKPAIRYLIPESHVDVDEAGVMRPQPSKPLPSLDDSDDEMQAGLAVLLDDKSLQDLFNPEGIVRRIVVTVDNLPRQLLARKYLPVISAPGSLKTIGEEGNEFLDPENSQRYQWYVQLADVIDTNQLVSVYTRLYPLFQQAYEELGYPSAYFNDRVVEVIDHLLATPEGGGAIRLIRPNVLYKFADPKLEALSAGQKTLLRMGDKNMRRIKAKLREIRKAITANGIAE